MKKLIVFDLDGTLARSKSSLDDEMSALLTDLLSIVKVAVISGGAWPQFEEQLLSHLPHDERLLNLSILPTCGTQFYRYSGEWKKIYSEDFTADQKEKIVSSLKKAFEASGFKADKVWGEVIEDRGSQITLSALGQQAPLAEFQGSRFGWGVRPPSMSRSQASIRLTGSASCATFSAFR